MNDRYSRLVVLLDLEPEGDRAIGVAAALASLGHLPVELITVASPGLPEMPDRVALERRAAMGGLESYTCTVLHSNDPPAAIAGHLATDESVLIVMASAARGAISDFFAGGQGAGIVAHVGRPMVVVGPLVPDDWRPVAPTLVVCIDPNDRDPNDRDPNDRDPNDRLAAAVRWVATFGGAHPQLVAVQPEPPVPMTVGHVLAAGLLLHGIESDRVDLIGDDPVHALIEHAAATDDAVLMVMHSRWADPQHVHLRSVSRRLAHESPRPLLVVPSTT